MGLDAVELILAVEETFGVTISDGDAAGMITPAMLIDHVRKEVSSRPMRRPCLSQRAFHKVRAALCEATGVPRRGIKPNTRIDRLFQKVNGPEEWQSFQRITGMTWLPDLKFGWASAIWPKRVGYLVRLQVQEMQKDCRLTGDWTDGEVRSTIREIICDQMGIKKFPDDDEFVRDLGMD